MKNLLLTTASLLCAFGISAQTTTTIKYEHNKNNTYSASVNPTQAIEKKYRASLVSGKMYVTSDGKVIYGSVMLKDGVELTSYGTIIWNDKSRTILKDGACVNDSGVLSAPVALNGWKRNNTKVAVE